jgi:hypothetical protein
MALELVWRNPLPSPSVESTVRRIRSDQCDVVYAVTNQHFTQEAELILGRTISRIWLLCSSRASADGCQGLVNVPLASHAAAAMMEVK